MLYGLARNVVLNRSHVVTSGSGMNYVVWRIVSLIAL